MTNLLNFPSWGLGRRKKAGAWEGEKPVKTAPPAEIILPEPDMSSYVRIDSGYVTGASAYMNLYADDSLRTGYNPLYFVLHDSASGNVMTDAHITIQPLNHGHAAPVENPDEDAPNGIYYGAMVFTESFTDIPVTFI